MYYNNNDYATKGAAYGISIPALVTGGLAFLNQMSNGGGIGGIFGGCNNNKELAAKDAKIAELNTEVKLRDSQIYTDQKITDAVTYLGNRIGALEAKVCDQQAYNAANNAAMGCIQGQIAQLFALTKLVVPNTSVCPGWGNVTITPAAAAAA